jgi:hypothetical protein
MNPLMLLIIFLVAILHSSGSDTKIRYSTHQDLLPPPIQPPTPLNQPSSRPSSTPTKADTNGDKGTTPGVRHPFSVYRYFIFGAIFFLIAGAFAIAVIGVVLIQRVTHRYAIINVPEKPLHVVRSSTVEASLPMGFY